MAGEDDQLSILQFITLQLKNFRRIATNKPSNTASRHFPSLKFVIKKFYYNFACV